MTTHFEDVGPIFLFEVTIAGLWRVVSCDHGLEEKDTYDDVQHRGELRENQDLVASIEERIEESLEQEHFAARVDKVVINYEVAGIGIRGPVEQEWMTRNLLCLRQDIYCLS